MSEPLLQHVRTSSVPHPGRSVEIIRPAEYASAINDIESATIVLDCGHCGSTLVRVPDLQPLTGRYIQCGICLGYNQIA